MNYSRGDGDVTEIGIFEIWTEALPSHPFLS